jgi:hypothetical protein
MMRAFEAEWKQSAPSRGSANQANIQIEELARLMTFLSSIK